MLNPIYGKNNLLIVEDSPVQAKKLKFLLEENGFQVGVASDGEIALEMIRGEKPVLIISDIVMPEMSGYELCSRIKSDINFSDIPVILLTYLRDPLDIIKGLQSGADNFITKPYNDAYLLSRINNLLSNRNVIQDEGPDMGIEILFRGQKYLINSAKKQMLDLLLSVYEAAVQQNDELVKAQAELQKLNEDLQAANDELDSFARTVSHDLRSPLNIILGYIDLIMYEKGRELDEETLEYLTNMTKSARSMANLIEDLLNFARAGKAAIQREMFNLSEKCERIISEMKMRDTSRRIEFVVQQNIMVDADTHLLHVVLENLLNNAWKYTSRTAAAHVRIGTEIQDNKTVIYISDNGDGFHQKDAHKLFDAFQRLHHSSEFPGTGIGLATVKRIIEKHGGTIWANGEKGTGATFYFTLPG